MTIVHAVEFSRIGRTSPTRLTPSSSRQLDCLPASHRRTESVSSREPEKSRLRSGSETHRPIWGTRDYCTCLLRPPQTHHAPRACRVCRPGRQLLAAPSSGRRDSVTRAPPVAERPGGAPVTSAPSRTWQLRRAVNAGRGLSCSGPVDRPRAPATAGTLIARARRPHHGRLVTRSEPLGHSSLQGVLSSRRDEGCAHRRHAYHAASGDLSSPSCSEHHECGRRSTRTGRDLRQSVPPACADGTQHQPAGADEHGEDDRRATNDRGGHSPVVDRALTEDRVLPPRRGWRDPPQRR